MPRETVEVAGTKYGNWTLVSRIRAGVWLMRCDCGVERERNIHHVRRRKSACRCVPGRKYNAERLAWNGMNARCHNPKCAGFKDYGERGIKVCDRWRGDSHHPGNGFANFLADMGRRPTSKHSIDRKNNDGDYEPGNCRWATLEEQGANRRNSRKLTLNGVTRNASEWSKLVGVSQAALSVRLDRLGWSVERALTTPLKPLKPRQKRM